MQKTTEKPLIDWKSIKRGVTGLLKTREGRKVLKEELKPLVEKAEEKKIGGQKLRYENQSLVLNREAKLRRLEPGSLVFYVGPMEELFGKTGKKIEDQRSRMIVELDGQPTVVYYESLSEHPLTKEQHEAAEAAGMTTATRRKRGAKAA